MPPDRPDPAARLKPLVAAGILAAAYWLSLWLEAPIFQSLSGWFWPLEPIVFQHVWLIPLMGLGVGAAGWLAMGGRSRPWVGLAAIAAAGYFFQVGLALLEGKGYAPFVETATRSGHYDFVKVACQEPSLLDVARNYESYIASERLGKYPKSKPPGQLLFYMLAERLAPGEEGESAADRRAATTQTVAWILPPLAYLALLPLYLFCRLRLDERASLLACMIYVVTPNMALAISHLDQALYPALFMATLWLLGRSLAGGGSSWAFAAGLAAWIATYFSFSLAPLGPLCAGMIVVSWAETRRDRPASLAVARSALAFSIGFASMLALFRVGLGYDMIERYRNAIAFHASWKLAAFTPSMVVYAAFLNYAEFAVWIGLPLAVVAVDAILAGLGRAVSLDWTLDGLWGALLFGVLLLLGIFGRTVAEVARLWLFLVPLACFLAAKGIRERFPDRLAATGAFIVALQFITTVFIKARQDF